MLEDLFSPPTWRPVSSVNIWNLSKIYKSTFPDIQTPKIALKLRPKCMFFDKIIFALCAGFQTKDTTELQSCKQK